MNISNNSNENFIYHSFCPFKINLYGQELRINHSDTIIINSFNAKKLVVYKLHNLSFYTDVDSFTTTLLRFRNGLSRDINSATSRELNVINRLVNQIEILKANSDTIFIDSDFFESFKRPSNYDEPWIITHYLASQIDCEKCIIKRNRTPILKLFRQKISHGTRIMEFDGGRRYILETGEVVLLVKDWTA